MAAVFVGHEGDLYDTERDNWTSRPLRRNYRRTHHHIETVNQLKATLRAGQYTTVGLYPLYFITSDGGALSFATVRQELENVVYAIRHGLNDGWRVVYCDVNWEDGDLRDDHTGERIESAYAEE